MKRIIDPGKMPERMGRAYVSRSAGEEHEPGRESFLLMASSGPLADRSLTCAECGAPFDFSVAEQIFYAERDIQQPAYCRACRAHKRAARNAELIAAYDAVSDATDWHEAVATYGGHRERERAGDGRRTRINSGGPKVTYRATCARCGRTTDVPFQPRGDRPVFCRSCFNQRRSR
jgi:CxxC-x17-CxxC domain-containing protein